MAAHAADVTWPSCWARPASTPLLGDHEVHVWAARLDSPHLSRDNLVRTLSSEERRRAGELHFAADRHRFVARRGLLRTILARYTGRDTRRLEFRLAASGKPELVQARGATPLEFNCSSSGDLALYAVARGLRVGVDVERVRAVLEPLELARSVLSGRDRAAIAALPDRRRHEAFLERWTWTEAHLKARGDGLTGIGASAARDATWSLRPLAPSRGYVGAVAAEGIGWRLRCWRW